MATENKYASSHLAGNASDPNNALAAADGTWTTDSGKTDWTSRWAMENPTDSISGTQTINVTVRKDAADGGTPTAQINLYENGSLVQEVVAATGVTSEVSQTLSGTFPASAVTVPNDVEIEIVATGNGGGPNGRAVQVDAIEWVVNLAGATVEEGVGSAGGSASVSADAESIVQADGSSTGVATVSGTGQSTVQADGTSAGVGTASGTGQAISEGDGASSAVATASAVAQSLALADGSSACIATASGVGQSTAQVDGSSAGVATVSGGGADAGGPTIEEGVGSSTGAGTVSGIAQALALAGGSSSAISSVEAVAQAISLAVGSSAGLATVSGVSADAGSGNGEGHSGSLTRITAISGITRP